MSNRRTIFFGDTLARLVLENQHISWHGNHPDDTCDFVSGRKFIDVGLHEPLSGDRQYHPCAAQPLQSGGEFGGSPAD